MLNSVGLQGPGVAAWLDEELPGLAAAGARVVASIWGRRVDDFAAAAAGLACAGATAGGGGLVAVEVNVSCPNVEDRSRMFAHSPAATAEAVDAAAACGLPRWAKLSPNVADLREIAGAALDAGAEAVTLVNTLLGLAIDPERRRPALGGRRRRAVRPGRRTRWPSAPSRSAERPSPTPASSGSAASSGATTRSSCCSPGPTRYRSARRRSATPGRRGRCSTGWSGGAARHRVAAVRELIGGAAWVRRSGNGWSTRWPERPALRRHRPVGRAARGLGAARRRGRPRAFGARVRRGVRRRGPGRQAAGRVLRAARLGRSGRPGDPDRRRAAAGAARRRPTPSAATSTARPRRTPTPGSAGRAGWPPTR